MLRIFARLWRLDRASCKKKSVPAALYWGAFWCGVTGAALVPINVSANAPPPGAIAVDLASGRIVLASDIDAPRRPASLAKLMTLYIAFEAMAKAEIARDTMIEISTRAAGQSPVKAYLPAGSRASFIDLVGATGVASANDAAVAVAEAVSGAEAAFVRRMNATAERLGMINTRFANPSGLPADGQRVTARDIALLARALVRDYPESVDFLSRSAVRAAGRQLSTTNPLIGSYPGAQGLKTGFTCKAGYSLAALARRPGGAILAVALGHQSKNGRNAAARKLLDEAFERLPTSRGGEDEGAALAPALTSIETPPPSVGSCVAGSGGGLRGWGAFLGAYKSRDAASKAVSAVLRGGAPYLRQRRRDRRWIALAHAMSRSTAVHTCLRARRAGRYCLTLPPTALRNRRAQWR